MASAWHGATCNLLISRRLWERYGPFPEDVDGGEDTLLTTALRRDGVFVFEPAATVTHLNRTRIAEVLAHQVSSVASRHASRLEPPTTSCAPWFGIGRSLPWRSLREWVLYARAFAWLPLAKRVQAVALFPLVVVGLTAWGAGLMLEGLRRARR